MGRVGVAVARGAEPQPRGLEDGNATHFLSLHEDFSC